MKDKNKLLHEQVSTSIQLLELELVQKEEDGTIKITEHQNLIAFF